MMSFFQGLSQLPEDPILGIPRLFAADPRPDKVNLGIGAYKTADGLPFVLTSVEQAEQLLLQRPLNKEYLPIEGNHLFIEQGMRLLMGEELSKLPSGQFFGAQTVGGASALRIAGELLIKLKKTTLFIPDPSWSNHRQIFEQAGLRVETFPYLNYRTLSLDYAALCQAIQAMPAGSPLLFHACCHNPTGVDPTFEQWKELSTLIKKQRLFPIFDVAYQGFGETLDEDAKAVRTFAREGHEMLVAYSFSKNFGLYGERAGFLMIIGSEADLIPKVASHVKRLIRTSYSNPPLHGAQLVSTILSSPELTATWKAELHNMCQRVKEMRKALVASLFVYASNKDFLPLAQQKGLFSFTGLSMEQVHRLRKEKGIYMTDNGRLNIAGLNTKNVDEVAQSIACLFVTVHIPLLYVL